MKSFKVKALALAVFGLGGLAVAGSAMAVTGCPAAPDQAHGGAWSGLNVASGGAATIAATGLESPTPSACKLSSVLTTNSAFGSAAVVDNSPGTQGNVTTYRAQFLINADAITSSLSAFDGVQIFGLNAANSASTSNPTTQILKMTLSGGATKHLNFISACTNGTSDRCSGIAALAAGVNRVEIQVIIGSGTNGQVNWWINNTNSATPTGTIATALGVAGIDNHLWVAGNAAVLGLANATNGFRTGTGNQLNHAVFFDAFDSRRSTFIGGG